MKKIIASILVLICFTPAMADVKCHGGDKCVNINASYRTDWNFKTSGNYTESNTGWHSEGYASGAWNFPDVTYISAARNIYKYGARFCRMNLGHIDGTWDPWIDQNKFCAVVCKNNRTGTECQQTINDDDPIECDDTDFTTIFRATNSDPEGKLQNLQIDVFDADEYSVSPLVIVEVKPHAIRVRPIEIAANDDETRETKKPDDKTLLHRKDRIDKFTARGGDTWLCAQGYKFNSDTNECTRPLRCNDRCPAGQGFKSTDNTTCITCNATKRYGVMTNGVCTECELGKIFSDTTGDCITALELSRDQMRENETNTSEPKCWKLMTDADYEDCVKKDR